MGVRQPTAPSDLSSDELVPPGDSRKPRVPEADRVVLVARAAGLIACAIIGGWVLLDDYIQPPHQKALEAVAVLAACVCAFAIAAYSRRRSVEIERSYSGHLEGLSRRLRDMAYRDSHTGLYNHRYFQEQLVHEVERAQRYGHHLSVLMLDVDRFKQVNDTYGHLMGDTLLSHVAYLIGVKIRSSDLAARYGGDEFAVILPQTNQEEALAVADKLSNAVSTDHHWQATLLENVGAGLSFGVATFPLDGRTADDLLVCADRRLYNAKRRRPHHSSQDERPLPTPVDLKAV